MSQNRNSQSRAQRRELEALSGDERTTRALELVHQSRDLELTRFVIGVIGDLEQPSMRNELVRKYDWCDEQPNRRDGGGFIRAAIIRALRPISGPSDVPLFIRGVQTYEHDGAWETCADLRAAALLAMNDVNSEIAANIAARFLHDPEETLSGEPATTAISLLASHSNLAPIFGMVSWGIGRPDVVAEGLRNLVDIPTELVPVLVDRFIASENEQIILGLFDLLLGHRSRDEWSETIAEWFRTTTVMDLYGIIAVQIVASRSEQLIAMLRSLRHHESDRLRCELLDQALTLV